MRYMEQNKGAGPLGPDGIGAGGGPRPQQKEGMMMLRNKKRLCAMLLSGVMLVSQLPITAMAESAPPEDGQIAAFEALPAEVAEQTVPLGTALEQLELPDTVTASVYHVREDVVTPVVPGEPQDPTQDSGKKETTVATATESIPVAAWDSDPLYDGDAEGGYAFTARIEGHTLAPGVEPPKITVTVEAPVVEEPEPGKTVTGWTFVEDDYLTDGVLTLTGVSAQRQADLKTVVSMLPTQLSGTVEGEADPVTLDLTWSCPDYRQDAEDNWPLTGSYLFTGSLPEGYDCDPVPTVTVLLPKDGSALLASAPACTCKNTCVLGDIDDTCEVCKTRPNDTWQVCTRYPRESSNHREILSTLVSVGLEEQYAALKPLMFYGVIKCIDYSNYKFINWESVVTELDISAETLKKAAPGQGPLSGPLSFRYGSHASGSLHVLDCTGQQFTEIDLSGCPSINETYWYTNEYGNSSSHDGDFKCAGNPVRYIVLPNGSSVTVRPYSGGTVTIKSDNFAPRLYYSCDFTATPAEGYRLAEELPHVSLDLSRFPARTAEVTPVFLRTEPEAGYAAADVAAIQKIIKDNGFTQYVSNDYSGWETAGLVKWSTGTPRRVTELNVANTGITSLDVSALTGLTTLNCGGNPISYLKLPNNASLTVAGTTGGRVALDGFDWGTQTATLTATAFAYGYSFYQWSGASSSMEATVSVQVTGNLQVTAEFQNRSTVYHSGDVEAVRALIRELGLNADEDPATWEGSIVYWSNDTNNKRVITLMLGSASLPGVADVSDLTVMSDLYCDRGKMTGLILGDLPNLKMLNCGATQLRSLDVSGCGLDFINISGNRYLTSYTGLAGHTATVRVDGDGGTAYLEPGIGKPKDEVKVVASPNAGWQTKEINPSATLDISTTFATATVTFELQPKPGAPTVVTATGGEYQATLAWKAPTTGGAPTGYEVTCDNWTTTRSVSAYTLEYTFTGLALGEHTLQVRAVNYAGTSDAVSKTCTVEDTVAPKLKAGIVSRESNEKADLTFESDEAGWYYYKVVAKGAQKPTIDTSGTGTVCVKGENTISLNLDAGAKEIYIQAKDAAGNLSNVLIREIPAYIKPPTPVAPTLTALTVDRTSDTAATVTFRSNMGGTYYTAVTAKGATEPTIDTSGTGTACKVGTNTIQLDSLAVGDQTLYIKAKNLNGNAVSALLVMEIPAYVSIAFEIEGEGIREGTDYSYANRVLTILSSTPMTIANIDPNTPTNHRIVVDSADGANLTLDGVNIDVSATQYACAFRIAEGTGAAAVRLLLAGENSLKSGSYCAGLETQYGAKLTIDSAAGTGKTDGTLTAEGGRLGAGIGGGSLRNSTVGIDVTISGGTINATTGGSAAGIGGGDFRDVTSEISITITGGIVNAAGGSFGAAIGGGYATRSTEDINVRITGGKVIADSYRNGSGSDGAGIGGGRQSGSTANITVTITDGEVDAKGGQAAAGIGIGVLGTSTSIEGNTSESTVNSRIEILGGIVTAQGGVASSSSYGSGAGIGGGVSQNDNIRTGTSGGTILITGNAHVTATCLRASDGAAIGGGSGGAKGGDGGTITISGNAQVIATAEGRATGIGGGGSGGTAAGSGGTITISGNAQVRATSKENGAGIGGGGINSNDTPGDSGTVIIKDNVVVFATAGENGKAIGGGRNDNGDYGSATDVERRGGIIFEKTDGQVYDSVTLADNLEIPQNHTLTVPQGSTLTNGHALTNNGVIDGAGTLTGSGTFTGNGEYKLKVSRTLTALSAATIGKDSVTLNAVTPSNGDGTVQYAVSSANLAPQADGDWKAALEFTGLTPSTDYYFFARVTGSNIFQNVVTPGVKVTTTEEASYSLAANPGTLDFGSAAEGYSAPTARTVTITNNSNRSVTLTKPTSTGYVVGNFSPDATLAVGGSATFTVQPKSGLSVGSHNETLTVGSSEGVSATVSLSFQVTEAPSYLLSASPNALNFGSVTQGAAPPAAQTVTVSNTGNQSVTLTKPTSSSYAVGDFSPSATLAAGGSATFTVQPRAGLDAGSYNESLSITGTGGAGTTVSLSFTVNPQTGGGGGGGGGGGSDNDDSGSITVTPSKPTEQDPNPPTESVITPPATVDKDGTVKVEVSDKDIQDAIDKAIKQAQKDGTEANGIAICIDLSGLQTVFYHLPLTLSENAYGLLVDAGVKYISILTPQISLKLDLKTLQTIHAAADGEVTIDAVQIDRSKLSDGARKALGSRPAYDLTIVTGDKTVSSFGGGHVAITLPYVLHDREQGGELQMVWVDANGQVKYMTGSSYSAELKGLLGRTNHFTVFGIAEKPAPVFTDIAGHWAKDDILFVASRGLLNGTGYQVFSPNGSMTRGMFVTALGRLAGVDPENYQTGRFTDVKADAYYAPFVNWAAAKGIVNGTGATTFSPDQPVTRQQMATIMQNYAKALGYELPITREAVTFVDESAVAAWAKDAVRAMQQAGILMGKEGNRFDPTGTATRAEVSALLHRFVELIIDPATAQGWDRNDSGKWVYYVDGKAVTGERVIDGAMHHFDDKGQLVKIDAVAPETKKYITYKVQMDDTLWSIAELHNCSVAEIVALNKSLIADPNQILVGWELKIPQV